MFVLNNKTSSNILTEEQQIEIPNYQFKNPKLFFCEPNKINTNHTEMALENQSFVLVGDDDSVHRRRSW